MDLKSIIKISIEPYQDECVYFTRVDSPFCYGVIACRVKITNNSNVMCGVNNIILKIGNDIYKAKPFDEIVVTNTADVKFEDLDTHFPFHMKVSSENIFNNLLLNPYETRIVYITFPSSVHIQNRIATDNKKAKLYVTVSGRRFVLKVKLNLISTRLGQIIAYTAEVKEQNA